MKVAVLMVVGAGLIAFSRYASKRGLLLEEDAPEENRPEVSPSRTTQRHSEPQPKSAPATADDVAKPSVNAKIDAMDLDGFASAVVTPLGAPAFRVDSKNLLKIMKVVVTEYGKSREVYLPGELLPIYDTVIKNYKSELPKATYESVAQTMKDFCKRGGSVTFK